MGFSEHFSKAESTSMFNLSIYMRGHYTGVSRKTESAECSNPPHQNLFSHCLWEAGKSQHKMAAAEMCSWIPFVATFPTCFVSKSSWAFLLIMLHCLKHFTTILAQLHSSWERKALSATQLIRCSVAAHSFMLELDTHTQHTLYL